MLRRLRPVLIAMLAAGAAAGAGPAAAEAASAATTSSNWAGYAVMKSGTTFRKVSSTWVQPAVSCTRGTRSFSAYWVGLGGYSTSAPALEQTGTEADCSANGTATYSAWYELVPSAAGNIRMTVHAGDRMAASVRVSGHAVRLRLVDDTTGHVFAKTLTASVVDTSSAEWIAEAPSLCDDASSCETQSLADFGLMSFSHAKATTSTGHTGTIADSAWRTTKITLGNHDGYARAATVSEATPAALSATGDAFAVSFAQVAPSTSGGGTPPAFGPGGGRGGGGPST